jgi:hypothetical protein
MNIPFRFSFLLTIILLAEIPVSGQYRTELRQNPMKAQVNMDQFNDPFAFTVKYAEAPHPIGKAIMRQHLREQKLEAQRLSPLRADVIYQNRSVIPPPQVLASFSGNNIISSTPLDNHVSVNTNEHVVSTINVHMLVTNNVGFWLGSYKLDEFFASVGITDYFFDPRTIYDPQQDRFIMVLMNNSDCNSSQIVLAFSQTNNPKGAWNLYAIDGCLNADGTFADYPMIAITETELFLTYNAVNADSSWQTGFFGTQIHQINKMNGFNGETLNRKVWTDISYNGRLLRNICPVRNADETLPTSMYFLSNRNFDISNDTVFLLHLTGQQDDPNATLDMSYRVLDQPYGVPPYAVQTKDSLDTNDGRVLDAFEHHGQIQWVSNTMDFNSGRSAIFHGFLQTEDPTFTAVGHVVAHPTDYLGYPGIAWTGNDASEQDAIIVMSHCSPTRNPGVSALYSDGLGQYSDIVSLKEGTRSVDMLTGTVERWGDYAGIQRLYHQPGSVWVSGSFGRQNNVNEAWIAKLARQDEMTAVLGLEAGQIEMNAYPNPVDNYVRIDIDNPGGKNITVRLFDAAGAPIETLYDGPSNYPGKASLNFSIHTLPAGQYFIHVMLDHQEVVTRSIVKM